MKTRRNRTVELLLALTLAVSTMAYVPGDDASAQGAQQPQGPAGNGWRSLVNLPTGTSVSFMPVAGIKQSSGSDWAMYTTTRYACGHCGFVDTEIHLKHLHDGRQIDIKGSQGTGFGSGDLASIQHARFAEPYLLWYQPGPGNASPPERFTPGQFECTLCYYNVDTGKGGPLTDLVPSLQIPGDKEAVARPVALDPTGTGRALISVTSFNQNTPQRLLLADLKSGELKEIATALIGQEIGGRGIVIHGDVIAWVPITSGVENANVYIYDTRTGQIREPQNLIGLNAFALRSNGKALFFSVPTPGLFELRRYDLATGQIVRIPNVIGVGNYDVYGDLLAHTPDKGRIVITDLRSNRAVADMTVITPEAAKESVNVSIAMSLSADKLVFSVTGVGGSGTAHAHHIGVSWLGAPNGAFDRVWAKADEPVASGKAKRSWLWGPAPSYTGWEPYAGLPGGKRQVRYYDKSRMEVNDPSANANDPFYVTNGLLVAEMIAGEVRLGESEIRASTAATLTVVGDPRKDNPLTPSYAALRGVASIKGDNTSNNRTGQFVGEAIDLNGAVSQERTNGRAAKYVSFVPQTGHNIPDLFWTYLQGMRGQYGFDWTYTMGYPITEAYWTQMRVSGKDYPVLIQAYQRRVMTYTPAFPAEWRVQQGNVGQHYFEWRYVLTNK